VFEVNLQAEWLMKVKGADLSGRVARTPQILMRAEADIDLSDAAINNGTDG
jgi:hypothetical protein